ncbi:hypothetical protein GZH53_06255 [Flavihumibacter sp. R14]|nr:hypothetical protein [Flavihumibacter soli]
MKIPCFYIENFRNRDQESELEMLVKNRTQKIVFRLFKENKDTLVLVAFSGRRNHKKFSEGVELKLKMHPSASAIDITNMCIFLGDMEIGSKGSDPVSELRRISKRPKPHEKYVVVEPFVEEHNRYIHYEIYAVPDLENVYRSAMLTSRFRTNPSPPYDGY